MRAFHQRLLIISLMAALTSVNTEACAVCFGKSDSAMAQGMNMGILTLLIVITSVLIGIAGTALFLARRASRIAQSHAAAAVAAQGAPRQVESLETSSTL